MQLRVLTWRYPLSSLAIGLAIGFVLTARSFKPEGTITAIVCLCVLLLTGWILVRARTPHYVFWLSAVPLAVCPLGVEAWAQHRWHNPLTMADFWLILDPRAAWFSIWVQVTFPIALLSVGIVRTLCYRYVSDRGRCPKCGYLLTGLPHSTCPECGMTAKLEDRYVALEWRFST